jgi:hypothetical protein
VRPFEDTTESVDQHSFVTSLAYQPPRKQGFPFLIINVHHIILAEMSWLRGKKSSVSNLKAEDAVNRSTTPTPGNPSGMRERRLFRSGLLTIRVLWAEGLALPQGVGVPQPVQTALTSQKAKVAASVSPSSVTKQRQANRSRGNRCVLLKSSRSFLSLIGFDSGTAFKGPNAGGYHTP